jgi:hypothetical protein
MTVVSDDSASPCEMIEFCVIVYTDNEVQIY